MHNLNTGGAYKKLRRLRHEQRQSGEMLDPYKLLGGLQNYSQRGSDYIKDIERMIKTNRSYMKPDGN